MGDVLDSFLGFQWDRGNSNKNLNKHNVQNWEFEQVFFNTPLLILEDPEHSVGEKRWAGFGKTDAGRLLVVIFTKRGNLVRVISARDMNSRRETSMKKMKRKIPEFKNEDEERDFWATHSPLDYFDSTKFKRVSFPNLKPSLKSISIRLPEDLLNEIKTLANKKDVPYQSLAKIFLAKQIVVERETLSRASGRRREKVAA
jgi:uncharacterized DUF497 family protein